MTVTRGLALALTIAAAAAVSGRPGTAADTPAAPSATLKAISERSGAKGPLLVIEASEPVPYLTTRPDPLTILLDFRNVGAEAVANSVASKSGNLVTAVDVERLISMGVPLARVRISLAEPVAHLVRSDRNTVVVELDRGARRRVPYVMPPATRGLPDAMQALAQLDAPAADPIAALIQRTAVAAGPSFSSGARPEGRAYTPRTTTRPALLHAPRYAFRSSSAPRIIAVRILS